MRKQLMLAALFVLPVVPAGTAAATADAGTPPGATVTVDAQHAGLLNRPPIIVTDARHAALVLRAGYRVRVLQPTMASDPRRMVPSGGSTLLGGWISGDVAGIALLGIGMGVLLLGVRPLPHT
jgi:hypothetical protein